MSEDYCDALDEEDFQEKVMEIHGKTKREDEIMNLARQIARRSKLVPSWYDRNRDFASEQALDFVLTYARLKLHDEAGLDECPECGGDFRIR